MIEANPRASRTVPFVSKAIGVPLAKLACRLMLGERLADQELPQGPLEHVSVKEAVLPFARFAGADSVLGPEMKSTGEVMGIAADFPTAFGKAQAAAGVRLPDEGSVFITVTDTDKPAATQLAARFHDLGFEVIATGGTAQAIERMGVPVTPDQQAGGGVAARRRPDPQAPLRPRDQHPDRLRRPRRRLRDPHRRGPPRDPLRDDDDRRHRGGAGDRRRPPGRRRGALASRRSTAATPRPPQRAMTAPFGRRLCEVAENRASGGYRVFSLLDREGPEPRAGPVLHARRGEPLGDEGGRPFLPRAISVAETGPAGDGVRLDFLVEGVGPGTDRLCELEEGEGVWVTGPLGNAFAEPARGQPGRRRGDPGRRRHRRRPAGPAAPPLLRARASRCASCSASATRAHSGGLELFCGSGGDLCPEVRLASEDGHAGHRGYVTDLLAAMLAGDDADSAVVYSCGPPAMLEAVRALCAERGRRLRAGPGVADGLRLRRLLRLRRAEARRRLPAPLRRRPGPPRRAGRRR